MDKDQKFAEETCRILSKHKEELSEDPDRLSTDFIISMIDELKIDELNQDKNKENRRVNGGI